MCEAVWGVSVGQVDLLCVCGSGGVVLCVWDSLEG